MGELHVELSPTSSRWTRPPCSTSPRRVERFAFDRVYGGWWGKVVVEDGAAAVRRSAERYVARLRGERPGPGGRGERDRYVADLAERSAARVAEPGEGIPTTSSGSPRATTGCRSRRCGGT